MENRQTYQLLNAYYLHGIQQFLSCTNFVQKLSHSQSSHPKILNAIICIHPSRDAWRPSVPSAVFSTFPRISPLCHSVDGKVPNKNVPSSRGMAETFGLDHSNATNAPPTAGSHMRRRCGSLMGVVLSGRAINFKRNLFCLCTVIDGAISRHADRYGEKY